MWYRLIDYSFNTKNRIVNEDLADDLEYKLTQKHPDAVFVQEVIDHEVFFDYPGPCWQNRTIETIQINGLKFQMPAQDYESLLFNYKLAPKKQLNNGTEYYEFSNPSVPCALVLTSGQRDLVIQTMESCLEEVRIQGEKDDLEFASRIRDLNTSMGYKAFESSRANAIEAASNGKKGSN
jgi:hypothetical protein